MIQSRSEPVFPCIELIVSELFGLFVVDKNIKY